MKGTLVHPPLGDPSIPPLGMSYLAADLEHAEVDYKVCDLNLDFIRFVERFGGRGDGERSQRREAPTALTYLERWRATSDAFRIACRRFRGFEISPFELRQEPDSDDLASSVASACDPNGPFVEWLDASSTAQAMLSGNPDWVGLSVSFLGQLPAALAIAAWIQRRSKAARIAGGALFRDIPGARATNSPLWRLFDGIVDGAGEGVLTSLVRDDLGLLRPRDSKTQGRGWLWAPPGSPKPPPEPCFCRFPLQEYRSSRLVLPYRVFPSCGWGRCTFCADAKYASHTAAEMGDPERIAKNLRALALRHQAAGFAFMDAALPAPFMEAFALSMSGGQLLWGANARFESLLSDSGLTRVLHEGGCRLLRLGLESASPRVLRKMRKGVTVDTASAVLKAVHAAGIVTHLYLMRGFPGETAEERRTTLRFLDDHADQVEMFSMSEFRAYDGAPISLELVNQGLTRHATLGHDCPRTGQRSREDVWDDEDELIGRFLVRKGGTRCLPSTADTILLGADIRLDYSAPRNAENSSARPLPAEQAAQAGAE